ncbi:MAG: hypothetical protein AAF928_16140 [Myxococcota bacterium]
MGTRVLVAGALALVGPRPACAQDPPTIDVVPDDNGFAIDLFQGVYFGPTRVSAMGGAYAGVAEGTSGLVANAATPAVRSPYSFDAVEVDVDAAFSIPLNLGENDDFDNSGERDADYSRFVYLEASGLVQVGRFGVGVFADVQRYALTFPPDDAETTFVTVGRYHALAGWRFLGNQLAVGAGVRALSLSLTSPQTDLSFVGVSPQVGVTVRPDWTPFRIGATYRHPVSATFSIGREETDDGGRRRVGNLLLPREVEMPWEIEVGAAVQVGARPLNPEWLDPEQHRAELDRHYEARIRARAEAQRRRLASFPPGAARRRLRARLDRERWARDEQDAREHRRRRDELVQERRLRAQNWPRDALLLLLDIVVTGPVDNGVGLEPFLSQGQARPTTACPIVGSGRSVSYSPRFGLEVEPLPRWVHTRFGSYYEPQRYTFGAPACADRSGRQHFTFGADVKLFRTTWFGLVDETTYKLQGYGDIAPRYQAFGVGLGVWH